MGEEEMFAEIMTLKRQSFWILLFTTIFVGFYGCSESEEKNAANLSDGDEGMASELGEREGEFAEQEEEGLEGEGVRPNPAGIEWLGISAGSFEMGCVAGDENCEEKEKPAHTVTLEAYEIAETETTCAQMAIFLNEFGNECDGEKCVNDEIENLCVKQSDTGWEVAEGMENLPQNYVSWFGAKAFCEWAGGRLPSEAQWEYAARAGSETVYTCGDDSACLDSVAWGFDNSEGARHEVGLKEANAFGLYDVQGNVWEWVLDCPHDSYDDAPDDGSAWLEESCMMRVLRGGSWDADGGTPAALRLSRRGSYFPNVGDDDGGFRCVRFAAFP